MQVLRVPTAVVTSTPVPATHIVILAAITWVAVWVSFLIGQFVTGGKLLDSYLGGDFAQFYIAGKILNVHGASALYDVELHSRMFRELHHVGDSVSLWYVYSPTLAMLFRPISFLPFESAYGLWCCAAVLLYVDGVRSIMPFLAGVPVDHRRALLALAFSFFPFIGWSLIGGQVSVIAFALLARVVRSDLDGNRFTAGVLLAFCAYKPTMLLVIVPSLAARHNWRIITGFLTGILRLLRHRLGASWLICDRVMVSLAIQICSVLRRKKDALAPKLASLD